MDEKNEKRIREKLEFFLEEKVRVHVKRNDRQFWNGEIIEKKNENVFLFHDDKIGLCHLFVADVFEVEERR
jgi:ribosome maturation factor RimP